MAPQAGGRARSVQTRLGMLDNGQHILIGAYTHTLALLHRVGAAPEDLLLRQPLRLAYPDGRGLALPPGPPLLAFTRGVMTARGWSWADRLGLMRAAIGWLARRFQCPPAITVEDLCAGIPHAVRRDLIEPLCVAALNTPITLASGTVFLRVLKDALFSGSGSADLLLPRQPLSQLLPAPALAWLASRGANVHLTRRVMCIAKSEIGWQVDGEGFDAVVLACSATEASRLTAAIAPDWSARSAALRYEPIVTAYLHDAGLHFSTPMMALAATSEAPAQFAFDLGALGMAQSTFAFVISGARDWVERGLASTGKAVLQQAREAFGGAFVGEDQNVLCHIAAEQRATFACTPSLDRPPAAVAPGLSAAGDYIEGPYPATLEGAVRSGQLAAAQALSD